MTESQSAIYQIVIWGIPVLLAILSFIGSLSVRALIKMGKDVGDIKISIERISTKHDSLERRVDSIEKNIEHISDKIYK